MLDITGQFAIPLARPYSDVPPPYGRRRTPFVRSKRPRPGVFDLRAAASPEPAPARRAEVKAADFGSDNRAWMRVHVPKRRLLMLGVCMAFGLACIVVTHAIESRQLESRMRAPSPDTVREAAISVAAGSLAPVAAVVAPQVASAAPVAASGVHVARPDSKSAAIAAKPASNLAIEKRGRRVRTTIRMPERPVAKAPDGPAAPGAANVEIARPKLAAPRRPDAVASSSAPGAAAAVGMTAAEFAHWLNATREPARPVAVPSNGDASLGLTRQTRLVGQ
ncbi:hypothetical protein [Burkholderia pyrrocinia]|uniref:hypothetical protein n=1 Tax=Burkholderia pyrrocinia TaxID=60550 RepID=UPI002AB01354|nr:hypothetical protein [Burkholderia pyrrocinia]